MIQTHRNRWSSNPAPADWGGHAVTREDVNLRVRVVAILIQLFRDVAILLAASPRRRY